MRRVISLFSGVGTFDYGFHLAGWETVYMCEWDPKAREVLTARFPGVPLTNDVCEVNGADLPDAEMLMFGSPCQDLSVAGKRAGLDGAKSGLFREAIRIIREKREATNGRYPAVALWENVPGAFSSNDGRDFAAVIHEFLDCGARDCGWRVLDAQFFGVPQRRRRIFLVADFGGKRAREILFEPDSVPRGSEAGREAQQVAPPGVRNGAEDGGWPVAIAPTLDAQYGRKWGSNQHFSSQGGGAYVPAVARCQTARNTRQDAGTENLLPAIGTHNGVFNALTTQQNGQGTGLGSPRGDGSDNLVIEPIAFDHSAGFGATPPQAGLAPTLLAGSVKDGGRGRIAIAFSAANEGGAAGSTLVTPPLNATDGGNTNPCIAFPQSNLGVRRLTPGECEALQGMPLGWTDVNGMADSHRYRFMGNGGAAPVLKWLAERIGAAL